MVAPQLERTASNETLSFTLHHREGDGEVIVDDDEDELEAPEDANAPLKFKFSWRKLWRYMGPGWLMSLAYLDPGNLESDLQTGAYTGFHLVWVLWWATVAGLILQELAARVGVVTGKDLAQNVREKYPRWLNYVVYINMEIAVIASDIQEVVGSGIALTLLTNGFIPVWIGCIITGLDTFTFLAVHYLGARYLEALVCFLIACMSGSFFINWGETSVDNVALVRGWIVPTMPSYAITQAVGTIGAVIMPHNLYLHSGLVLSRKIDRASPRKVHEATWYNFLESALALLFSFIINLAIIATNAGNFYNPDCATIGDRFSNTTGPQACLPLTEQNVHGLPCGMPGGGGSGRCDEIGLKSEGDALRNGIGDFALYIWALGLLAAGQAATMTCTYAGQIIMGGCLQIELAPWKRVALTRIMALGPSILIAAATIGNDKLFETINEYLNVLQSVQLPFAMLPLLHICSKADIMGRFRSGPIMMSVNFLLAATVLGVNALLIMQFIDDFPVYILIILSMYAVIYLGICARMLYPCR
jgi:natural resistance-associated macrophage protein